ncbi:MAG: D-Ala-D-Ala carboxypeptidase family metallohydrolase [Chlamydiota bacterium]
MRYLTRIFHQMLTKFKPPSSLNPPSSSFEGIDKHLLKHQPDKKCGLMSQSVQLFYRASSRYWSTILCLLFMGCSGLQQSEQKKLRRDNLTLTSLGQLENPTLLPPASEYTPLPTYPWDEKWIGANRRINKEFFRCRGNASHHLIKPPGQLPRDCRGIDEHSLPVKGNCEFIYPILIDLLNHIQKVTGRKVVITSGHRCPHHNTYADPSCNNRTSKHQIGAEVDFYVEGIEHDPHRIVAIVLDYYKNQGTYPRERYFARSKCAFTKTPSWINREISITLAEADEKRDLDNTHPYPYLTIEVLYDKERGRPVFYSWHRAHYGSFQH